MTTMRIRPGMSQGERIKALRERAGLTQEQAAGLLGKSVSLWRKYERDERRPRSFSDWMEIASILGVRDMSLLIGRSVTARPDEPREHESVHPIRSALTAWRPAGDPVPGRELSSAVSTLWDLWHASSPWRYARVGGELPGMIRLLRATLAGAEADQRRAALRASSMLYQLTRAYLKRVGAHDLSLVAADRSIHCAIDADDPGMAAAGAWNLGNVLSNTGHTEEALDVALAAAREIQPRIPDGGDPYASMYGALHQLAAVQAARLDRSHDADTYLEEAARTAARTGERNDYRTAFGPTNVEIHRATVERELSRYGQAVRIAESTEVTSVPSVERRCTHYVELAHSYAQRRQDLGAIVMLRRAHDESPEETLLNPLQRNLVTDLIDRETPTTAPELRPLALAIGVID